MAIFPDDYVEKLTIAADDMVLFSDSEDGDKLKKAKYSNLKWEKWDTGEKWDTWATGSTWATGATGATWPAWPKWDTWAKWDTGAEWPAWPTWPQWPAGTDWDDWVSFTPRWDYDAWIAYVANDVVSYLGSSWTALQNTTGNIPTEWANWTLLAAKGTDWIWAWDVIWPATNTDSYIPQRDWVNTKTLKNWLAVPQGWLAGLTALWNKVEKNAAIAEATKTKITYDAKWLVTDWEDATTADIADSTDKRYVTDAQLTVLGNTSNTNTGDEVVATWAEVDTGTNDTKMVTPKAIAGSKVSYTDWIETLTNKRINPRIVTAASYTTDTGTSLSVATTDIFVITAQAGALKFNNPWGTPLNGQKLMIRIKDNGTARVLTYDTQFRAIGVTLPTTTVISKTLYIGCVYNSDDTKRDILAVGQEA